jgi:hypothetical protein
MRVTIVVDDNIVLVDGKARTVDCSPLVKDGTHAVQWHDVVGEVEFRTGIDAETKAMTRQPNQTITDFSPYQSYVEQWRIENAKQELIEAAQQKQMDDNQQAAAKTRLQQEAWMKLPLAVQQQLIAEQQDRMIAEREKAALAEQQRLDEWMKLSSVEQQRLIAEARPTMPAPRQ